ncbi:MAG: hypothetical protein Q4D27_07675 [Coriobacteriia bacterium]|nr:hypothetical protein [Coriobacteriia bacterium]
MLETDERMDKVLRKASRMKRRRARMALPALSACAVLLGVGLIGAIGAFGGFGSPVSVDDLYGASSLMGSEAGGYVIVALLAAALAVVVTLICVIRSGRFTRIDLPDNFEKEERND